MSLCTTCSKADVSCPIYPQDTEKCVEYAPLVTIQEQALKSFGSHHQLVKSGEEAVELGAAILRYLGDPSKWTEVVEEAADVEICSYYLRQIFGNEAIDKAKAEKLDRLAETIRGS